MADQATFSNFKSGIIQGLNQVLQYVIQIIHYVTANLKFEISRLNCQLKTRKKHCDRGLAYFVY